MNRGGRRNRLRGNGNRRHLQRRELEGRRRHIAKRGDGRARAGGEGGRNRDDIADCEGESADRTEGQCNAASPKREKAKTIGCSCGVLRTG
jgi:hypothetical protein